MTHPLSEAGTSVPGPNEHEAWKARAIEFGAEVNETPFGTVTKFKHLDELISFALSALIQPVPAETEGDWVLVPREPTEAMTKVGRKALVTGYRENDFGNGYSVTDLPAAYRAMLAASPTPPPIGDGEGPKPFAWYWEATDGQSAWPVWSMQSERPKHAPDRAVPVYLRPTPPPIGDGEGDLGWKIANEFWLETTDKAKLARRIRTVVEALRAERDLATVVRDTAIAQVSTLSRQLEEAREALKPFVKAEREIATALFFGNLAYSIVWPDDMPIGLLWNEENPDEAIVSVTWGDFRRAKETLSHD